MKRGGMYANESKTRPYHKRLSGTDTPKPSSPDAKARKLCVPHLFMVPSSIADQAVEGGYVLVTPATQGMTPTSTPAPDAASVGDKRQGVPTYILFSRSTSAVQSEILVQRKKQ